MPIPYASWVKPDYKKRECPLCHEQFEEGSDQFGETTTQNYAQHFHAVHGDWSEEDLEELEYEGHFDT